MEALAAQALQLVLKYGPLGFVLVLIVTGKLVPNVYHNEIVGQLKEQLKNANDEADQLAKGLSESTSILKTLVGVLPKGGAQ